MVMGNPVPTLAGDLPQATRDDWLRLVTKVLKGADPGKRLVRRTYDGIGIQPLYTRGDSPDANSAGWPGHFPFVRGGSVAARPGGWEIRQRHQHPDPTRANASIREDLAAGVEAISLRIDMAWSMRQEPPDGCCVLDIDDLDAACAGVDLAEVPVGVEGARFGINAALLVALWRRRGIPLERARGALNVDPLGVAARGVGVDLDAALDRVGEIAAYTDHNLPHATALMCDGHVYHAGGGSEAQELAGAMATAVDYLRAAERAGLPPERAARQIVFRFAADTDIFLTVAKLRAARALWARVCEACGAGADPMRIEALTATRMYTRRDAWNNLMRATLAGTGAALGGADRITVLPFDHALGLPGPLARRLARNIQLVLREESGLGRTMDPTGGAWFIEEVTRRLAREAWSLFQAIEGGGGMAQMLLMGTVQDWISSTLAERMANIARRAEPITGVSEFPALGETPPAVEPFDPAPLIDPAAARLEAAHDTIGRPFGEMIEACLRGEVMQYRGRLSTCTALPPVRLAASFEALRDRSDAILAARGSRPRALLQTLRSPAEHGARLMFARNLFAAAGIETIELAAPEAGAEGGCPIVALCGSDEGYAAQGAAAIQALKQAGCRKVWVMGRPPEIAPALREAGADACLRLGDDVVAILDEALEILGEVP
jgi:methylmalonyl-CoA mutase